MEISRIDDQNMVCVVSPKEIADRGISVDEASYSSLAVRSLVREIASHLIRKYKFGTNSSPSIVNELIPMEDGSLVIIFSIDGYEDCVDPRYSVFSDADADIDDDPSESNNPVDTLAHILKTIFDRQREPEEDEFLCKHGPTEDKPVPWIEEIFEFECFDDVVNAISQIFYNTHISIGIYRSAAGSYIVPVYFYDRSELLINRITDALCDYGFRREVTAFSDLYIEEHCKQIIRPTNSIVLYHFFDPEL